MLEVSITRLWSCTSSVRTATTRWPLMPVIGVGSVWCQKSWSYDVTKKSNLLHHDCQFHASHVWHYLASLHLNPKAYSNAVFAAKKLVELLRQGNIFLSNGMLIWLCVFWEKNFTILLTNQLVSVFLLFKHAPKRLWEQLNLVPMFLFLVNLLLFHWLKVVH